jgi:hypothetical protein
MFLAPNIPGGEQAEAASRSIRLHAHVPVICGFKSIPRHGLLQQWYGWDGRGAGYGNFKIVCNTPYHMHMEGRWEPAAPSWPWIFPLHQPRAHKNVGIDLRLVGHERTVSERCELPAGRSERCHAFGDDGAVSPPRQAQAQISVDIPWGVAGRARGSGPLEARAPFHVLAAQRNGRSVWPPRMRLGALPQVASAGDPAYLPKFLSDISQPPKDAMHIVDAIGEGSANVSDTSNEHITVYLTLTGRY